MRAAPVVDTTSRAPPTLDSLTINIIVLAATNSKKENRTFKWSSSNDYF